MAKTKGGYVDGFVIPVPRKNLKAYKKMAQWGAKAWMRHGALAYMECVGDDMKETKFSMAFPKMVKPRKGEVVMFSFIVYKSRAHRDAVNKSVIKEMMKDPKNKDMKMPFDCKRMAYGGFKAMVRA